ncbi:protein takeout-like [Bradysia coprophila]|uniref:protein takeout-like n=1 Tax=Bradysia coprophila TaxID=38358 RepID=UPI00187DC337|nr:protein takeout-like [Bradysia coprophila]
MIFVRSLVALLVLVFVAENAKGDDFPSSIERCKFEDNECLKKSWNKYIKLSGNPNGLPELKVPDTHNYKIPMVTITPGEGPLDVKLIMRDIDLTGFDHAVVDRIDEFPKDPKQMSQFTISIHISYIRIEGMYNVTGKVLLLPVTGADEGEVKFDNVRLNVTAYTSTKMVDGKEYLKIRRVSCSYDTDRIHYRFENILNNKEISDSINRMLNENQDLINNEVKPSVIRILSGIFKRVLVDSFTKYPYSSYFL